MSNSRNTASNDDLPWIDDVEENDVQPVAPAWRLLVVDDDADVHAATAFALRDATFFGRPVEIISAHSGKEALDMALSTSDIAVALVDVVMETPEAGLHLVRSLRQAGCREMRIILRTGYPGYAPEMSIITDYEIDDYRTKEELTQTRLLSLLTASIRAYDQISTIARSRAGLEMIVESASRLFQRTNLEIFSQGVLTQIASLLGTDPCGFVSANNQIVSAAGRFSSLIGQPLDTMDDPVITKLLSTACGKAEPVFADGYVALHFRTDNDHKLSAVLETHTQHTKTDFRLLKLFSTNIAIGFENLALVETLDRLAYVDPVLDIPNLNGFEATLQEWLDNHGADGRLALTRIDSYESILATYGPQILTPLLQEVHTRLTEKHGTSLTVARIGDGTFGLFGDRQTLDMDMVPGIFARPYRTQGIEIALTGTTAIIDIDDATLDPPSLLRTASSALIYAQQTRHGECTLYDSTMRAEVERRKTLQIALKHSVENDDGLSVHLQPKVDLQSGEILGAEALLRWHWEGEPVSPAEFIPIAEAAGLIQHLTDFVLRTVADWSRNRAPLPVAVNLSMVDLNTPGFAAWLMERHALHGLSPETLEYEVTEGVAMHNTPFAMEQVRMLRGEGFRIALDDFGTGYSSLGQFSRLPIDTLKIDRSFVVQLDVATARTSLAAVILAMSSTLNVDCVAEGIETEEQKQALQFLGCRVGQGYLLGRPVPIETFESQFLSTAD